MTQKYLERWHLHWMGESLPQGSVSYVLPCRTESGISVVLKLNPDTLGAQEEATALSAWDGIGAASLVAESFDENGGALLIARIDPGHALWPPDDPSGSQIARCIRLLHRVPAVAVGRPLPSGYRRLTGFLQINAQHVDRMGSRVRQYQDKIAALAETVGGHQRSPDQAVLLHGDLNPGNLLVSKEGLIAIDPIPAVGEPEQDIGEAAAKNNWGPDLPFRAKALANACGADHVKVAAYTRLAAWNAGLFHAGTGTEAPGRIDPDELVDYAIRESV
jgi:streptomycin 6-kinase